MPSLDLQSHSVANGTFAASAVAVAGVVPEFSGALGNNGKAVFKALDDEALKGAVGRRRSKQTAARLLSSIGMAVGERIGHCGVVSLGGPVEVRRNVADGSTFVSGVKTCSSVHCCPICSARIGKVRCEEVNSAIAMARETGLSLALLTVTFRHDRSMPLADGLQALKRARRRSAQRRQWKALGLFGTIIVTEITHGENAGWHPHQHILVFADMPADELQSRLEAFEPVWLECLEKEGLSGKRGVAFHVQPASAVGAYLTKMATVDNLAPEMALGGQKTARMGGRTPMQLLDAARDGDRRAAALFCEMARATHGTNVMSWSPGLKTWANVKVRSDDEISEADDGDADDAEPEEDEKSVVVRRWETAEAWSHARERICSILHAAQNGLCLDAAENGPTDREIWWRFSPSSAPPWARYGYDG